LYADRAEVWEAEHFRRRCLAVAPLVTPEMVEEHRRNPFGYRNHHSLALQRVDRLLKTYPASGARLSPVLGRDGKWKVMSFSREKEPKLTEEVFSTLDDAVHAIFVMRLEALELTVERESPQ
jgi:hypothetical protein